MLPIWSVFPVCRCLRGDRAFTAAGSAYIELGERCLGTDAGGCRIWLYPVIPDWLENQYSLTPGQCQRGAPPGRYRRPVLQRRSAAPADHRHHPVPGRRFFPASIKKGDSTNRQLPATNCCSFIKHQTANYLFLQTIFFCKLSFPGLRAIYPCRPVLFSVQFSVQNSTSSQRNEKIA